MRVSERLVVQQVDRQLVFVDESGGAEATVPLSAVMGLANKLQLAHAKAESTYWLTGISGSEPVPIDASEYAAVSYALGYFAGRNYT